MNIDEIKKALLELSGPEQSEISEWLRELKRAKKPELFHPQYPIGSKVVYTFFRFMDFDKPIHQEAVVTRQTPKMIEIEYLSQFDGKLRKRMVTVGAGGPKNHSVAIAPLTNFFDRPSRRHKPLVNE
jgi:hypothetical protein